MKVNTVLTSDDKPIEMNSKSFKSRKYRKIGTFSRTIRNSVYVNGSITWIVQSPKVMAGKTLGKALKDHLIKGEDLPFDITVTEFTFDDLPIVEFKPGDSVYNPINHRTIALVDTIGSRSTSHMYMN